MWLTLQKSLMSLGKHWYDIVGQKGVPTAMMNQKSLEVNQRYLKVT